MDGHRAAGMRRWARGPLRRVADRSRRAKTALSRSSRRLLHGAPVPIEIVLDGGGLLNWRCLDPEIAALALGPTEGGTEILSPRSDRPGPPNGRSTVDAFSGDAYRLTVIGSRGRRRPVSVEGHRGGETRNEAWSADGSRWRVRTHQDRDVLLVREDPSRRKAAVQDINAVLGVVSISVGPLVDGALVLRRRDNADVLMVPSSGPAPGGGRAFRLGAATFPADRLDPADGMTVWDVGVRGPGVDVPHAHWEGSGLRAPRAALRLRRSVSFAPSGAAAVSLRPYWTTGQRLSLEVRALTPMKGPAS